MFTIKRTTSEDTDFKMLVAALDKDLALRDGDEHSFYAQFNSIASIPYVVVAYDAQMPVGCGALKPYDDNTLELKRMFVPSTKRGQGIASLIVEALEHWAKELEFKKIILETGNKQPEAIALYHKNHYHIIPNYGQYEAVENSVCFEKVL
jgi:GNAT superfamily N-acetyltransferase